MKVVHLTILSPRQYCVVLDPLGSDGKPRLGCKELRTGPNTFFLHPGELGGGKGKGVSLQLVRAGNPKGFIVAEEDLHDMFDIHVAGNEVHVGTQSKRDSNLPPSSVSNILYSHGVKCIRFVLEMSA